MNASFPDQARVVIVGAPSKAMAFLPWTPWGVLQEANENQAPAHHVASYWDYAMDRFTRSGAITGREDFGSLLEAVRRGDAGSP